MSVWSELTEEARSSRLSRRAFLLGVGQVGVLGFLANRLYETQVVFGRKYAVLADENRISVQPIAPTRGRILDSNGLVLADTVESLQVHLVPKEAGDIGRVLERLADVINVPEEERERVVQLAARQSGLIAIPLAVTVDWDEYARLNVLSPELPGIRTVVGGERRYPFGSAVGHLVGYVGQLERFAIDDEPMLRLPGVRVGKMGVELGMEEELRGKPGHRKLEVDARGNIVRILDHVPGETGRDVRLTVNTELQRAVLDIASRQKSTSVVVLDCDSGDVIAMASNPSFDPADIAEGITRERWRDLVGDPGKPLLNKTIRGQYPPGSTFKIVTALAGLEHGIINSKYDVECTGHLEYGGHKFGCWNRGGHGRLGLHEAMKQSCDVYFYEVARQLGIDRLAEAARTLGLGQTYDCGIALQKPGVIPDVTWKIGRFEKPWYGGETLLAGIGQGYVLSTPLQLAVMMARVATGREINPRLAFVDSKDKHAAIAPPLPFSPENLEIVRQALVGVVNEKGGTGTSAYLPSPMRVAGKTGTSQVSRASRTRSNASLPYHLRDHALFVAFAPADKPKYAVSVIVEHGTSGGKVAAPLARDVVALVSSFGTIAPSAGAPVDDGPLLPQRNTWRRG